MTRPQHDRTVDALRREAIELGIAPYVLGYLCGQLAEGLPVTAETLQHALDAGRADLAEIDRAGR